MNFGKALDTLLINAEIGTPAIIRRKNWLPNIEICIGHDDKEKLGVYLKKMFNGDEFAKFYPDQEDLFTDNWEVVI